MKNRISLRWFSILIMVYMLMAFVWWVVLLIKKNDEVLHLKKELLTYRLQQQGRIDQDDILKNTPEYIAMKQKHDRQQWMIFGEAVGFSLTLLAGLWFVNRAFRKEMQASAQQRNFLLSITHELKSPIASIRLILETFLRRKLEPDKFKQLSKGGLTETMRLNDMVNELLLSARLESAYRPDFELVDFEKFLQHIIEDFRIGHPQVQLTYSGTQANCQIKIDRQGMQTVVINLLENAVKYNFKADKRIHLSVNHGASELYFSVADNGSGISEAEKKKIFKKFYRVGNEDTRRAKGTGLGLYIVKEIVKAHRGSISVKDNQPTGTVFTIKLPLK